MSDPLERVPTPHEIKCRLSRSLREASFLRRLLKLAEFWQREREHRETVAAHNGKSQGVADAD